VPEPQNEPEDAMTIVAQLARQLAAIDADGGRMLTRPVSHRGRFSRAKTRNFPWKTVWYVGELQWRLDAPAGGEGTLEGMDTYVDESGAPWSGRGTFASSDGELLKALRERVRSFGHTPVG
jgi:hypothetical protein